MKRSIPWLLAVALLVVLVSCKQELKSSLYGDDAFDTSGEVELAVEYPVYDKTVTSFNYSVINRTEETVSFGQEFSVEMLVDGAWKTLPQLKDVGWDQILYTVAPGEAWSNSFSFWQYDFTVVDGTYRLIKEVTVGESDCRRLSVEFTIGESRITGEMPYGYVPLEELPETLDLETFACDLTVDAAGGILSGGQKRVEAFLDKVAGGTPAMLRLVTLTREGDPILHDIVYENNHFRYRVDSSRDRYAQTEEVSEFYQQRYSYIVTDGTYIYLSDYATLAEEDRGGRKLEAGSNVILCLSNFPDGERLEEMVASITEKRLENSVVLARYWSEDGSRWLDLTGEKNSFSVSTSSYGVVRTLPPEAGEAPEIFDVQWLSADRVQLTFTETPGGNICRAVYDSDSEQVVFMEGQE